GSSLAVGELHAPQDQLLVVADGVLAEDGPSGMSRFELEHGYDLSAIGAVAHERSIAASAERERERVEKDGLTGAGFAGEDGQPGIEGEIELIDQDDVANRQGA